MSALVFLGAGRPSFGNRPSALKRLFRETRALDWQLNSFNDVVNQDDISLLAAIRSRIY